ncbi:MAG: carboxypeptidase regulatory-like domain-containing protein [Planctomycetota bacterium]|nr:carboxypeptidase regulatory-like domain-containing protein [Planctomycetota bacterium]
MGGPGRESLAYLIVILLGVVGGLLWVFLQEPEVVVEEGPPGIDQVPVEDPDAPLRADGDAGTLEGRGTGEAPGPAALEAPPSTAAPATHVVRGTIRDADGKPLEAGLLGPAVTVHALREYGWLDSSVPAVLDYADEQGAYEVDVSSLLAGEEPPTQLRVDFDHSTHIPISRKLIVEDAKRLEADGPLVFEVDAKLEPATVVSGIARDENTEPLAQARVYLLRPTDNGLAVNDVGEPLALDETKSDADGFFQLRVPTAGRYYVAALAKRYLPEGVPIDVGEDGTTSPVELALRPGRTIAGRVLLNGQPLPEVRVKAEQRPRPKPSYQLEFDWVYLRDGRLHPGEGSDTTNKEGRFEITGLDAGERRVAPSWSSGLRIWPTLMQAAAQTVEAGRQDLVLEVGGVAIEVRPVSGGELIAKADVTVSVNDNEQLRSRTTEEQGAKLVLPPEQTFELEIAHPAFEPVVRELRTGPLGVPMLETVDLGPPKLQAVLVVSLKDDAGKPITRADIQVVDPDSVTSHGFDMEPVKRSTDGVYRLEGLEPGKRSVVVRPGRSSMEFIGHYLILREAVHLSPSEETRVDLVAKRGGRLRITVRDEAGAIRGCNATLRDARGETRLVAYVSGGEDFATMSTGGPGSASPSTVEPPLEPGEYELELSLKGFETKRVTAKVKAGETTDVEVTLRKL